MSPDDGDAFVSWSAEPAADADSDAAPSERRPSRQGRWSRYGTRNLVFFIVLVAAVLSLAASLASVGPFASSTTTTTTAPAGTTTGATTGSTLPAGTTSVPGASPGKYAKGLRLPG